MSKDTQKPCNTSSFCPGEIFSHYTILTILMDSYLVVIYIPYNFHYYHLIHSFYYIHSTTIKKIVQDYFFCQSKKVLNYFLQSVRLIAWGDKICLRLLTMTMMLVWLERSLWQNRNFTDGLRATTPL